MFKQLKYHLNASPLRKDANGPEHGSGDFEFGPLNRMSRLSSRLLRRRTNVPTEDERMGIFYFHLKHGDGMIADVEGVLLPDLAAARHEALQSARKILADAIKTGKPVVPDAVIVTDETGCTVDSLHLAAVLPQTLRAMIVREPSGPPR